MPRTVLSPRGAAVAAATLTVLCAGWFLAPETYSQAPAAATANATLVPLLAKLKTQQDLMVANQTKIETQTAALKEELREARLYSARGGSRR